MKNCVNLFGLEADGLRTISPFSPAVGEAAVDDGGLLVNGLMDLRDIIANFLRLYQINVGYKQLSLGIVSLRRGAAPTSRNIFTIGGTMRRSSVVIYYVIMQSSMVSKTKSNEEPVATKSILCTKQRMKLRKELQERFKFEVSYPAHPFNSELLWVLNKFYRVPNEPRFNIPKFECPEITMAVKGCMR